MCFFISNWFVRFFVKFEGDVFNVNNFVSSTSAN